MATRNIEARILSMAQRCHAISTRLVNKEEIIICLQMLSLVGSSTNTESQQGYLRMALVAYGRAMKENSPRVIGIFVMFTEKVLPLTGLGKREYTSVEVNYDKSENVS